MATYNVFEANSRTTPAPFGPGCLWPDNGYTSDSLIWRNMIDDADFASQSWTDTEFEGLQPIDSVPTAMLRLSVPCPELPHPSSLDGHAGQGGFVTQRQSSHTAISETKREDVKTRSIVFDRERRQDREVQHLVCGECGLKFENLQGLDRHTRSSLHRGWRCQEAGCGKTYARRDTFLRHCMKHTDSVHACSVCSRSKKHKVFKRKDHLNEHIRNCHARSVVGRRYVSLYRYMETGLTDE